MKLILHRILKILSSLKLTITTLTALIVLCIPAALIIQNQDRDFYLSRYPGIPGQMILTLGFNHFFSSFLFLFLIALIWINLLSCTVKRFTREFKKKDRGRYGPDILHGGLLILVAASLFSFSTRREGYIYLEQGESVQLPGGEFLNMEEFIYEQYPDGRPKSWTSRVNISESAGTKGEQYRIEVNKPLRWEGLVLYQHGYRHSETPGEYETGLMVTSDPGKIYILLSFLMISIGLVLTFIQKRE